MNVTQHHVPTRGWSKRPSRSTTVVNYEELLDEISKYVLGGNVKKDWDQLKCLHEVLPSGAIRIKRCLALTEYFHDWRHSENDGIWSGGYFKSIHAYQKNYETGKYEHVQIGREWIPRTFAQHPNKVVDMYGRTLNVNDIIYDIVNRDYFPKKEVYWRWRKNKNYTFRYDPVVGSFRNGWWHRYRGNHGHTIQEMRESYYHNIYRDEVLNEYGVTFKLGRSPQDLNPYNHAHHGGSKGRGWKRSRKKKQWM